MRETREIIRGSNWKTRMQRVTTASLCILLIFAFASDLHAAKTYTITASAGGNGSISSAGAVKVTSGGSKTFAITPNAGYHIVNVSTARGTRLGGRCLLVD